MADLIKKGSLRGLATVTAATVATVKPEDPSTVATVSVATAQKQVANDLPAAAQDPERWAWPHSPAMTGREIDVFTLRLARFTDKGISPDAAEALADTLVTRDRDADERRLCLECAHLAGYAAGACSCTNRQWAGVEMRAKDAQLSATLVCQLQRCDEFTEQP